MKPDNLIIAGGGPAGLTAALYACRARIPTLMLEKVSPGGQVLITDRVDNYPGFPDGIAGYELIDRMLAQAKRFGLEQENGEITAVHPPAKNSDTVKVELADGKTLEAASLIIATGASHNHLGVPGEEELAGRGVSYCATCDGPFFNDAAVAVVGGGDTAVQEAIFLTKFAKKVTLIHRRDELRAIKLLQEQAVENPKIDFIWDTVVESINGSDKVESLSLLNRKTGEKGTLAVDGVFIFVGIHPNTEFLKGTVEMNQWGFIRTDDHMKTSAPSIWAVGDCREKPLLQIVTAVADGAIAAHSVELSRGDT
jgi:thioredoxin reductase (NADPH)